MSADCEVVLWGSIPCTGGSPWQCANRKFPGYESRMTNHIMLWKDLWNNFVTLAGLVRAKNGSINLEWPKGCRYWRFPKVQEFLKEFNMIQTEIHGCAVGLKSNFSGKPIKKPWTIMTNVKAIREAFRYCRCRHKPEDHDPCKAEDAKRSENYTPLKLSIVDA